MKLENPLKLDNCSLYAAEYGCSILPLDVSTKLHKFFIVNSGEYRLKIDGKEHILVSGDAALLFPYEIYELTQGEGRSLCSYVCFDLSTVRYGDIHCGVLDENARIFADENLLGVVKNVCLELSAPSTAYCNELISLLSGQMLVYLSRHIGAGNDESAKDSNLRVCGQVMNFIDSRIYTMKNLREVAVEMGYNYSYISTLFRKTCGTTLNAYFKTKRMEEAKRLLQDNEMSVSEIARVMNYSSVYAFSKAFKEYFGASPGHYSGRFPKKEN